MHQSIKNLDNIKAELELVSNKLPSIIAVSKTFSISKILPLIEHGHNHFGENKVQEAVDKWTEVKKIHKEIKLHMIGKLQTNKVKFALPIFDYFHSLDNEKLARKLADEQKNFDKKPKIFIQINIGNETQKSGINKSNLNEFYSYCKQLELNIIGLMCIPPMNIDPNKFFEEMRILAKNLNLSELSMGMSADYHFAAKNSATFLRIGSKIFGERH